MREENREDRFRRLFAILLLVGLSVVLIVKPKASGIAIVVALIILIIQVGIQKKGLEKAEIYYLELSIMAISGLFGIAFLALSIILRNVWLFVIAVLALIFAQSCRKYLEEQKKAMEQENRRKKELF